MKQAIIPAIALMGAAAFGFVYLRDSVDRSVTAKSAVTQAELAETEVPEISSSQIRSASLRKEGDGHFWATAYVNEEPVRFLVDTGASLVALTRRDARRIGIDTDHLDRSAEVKTAGGRVKAATVSIDKIEIDGVLVKNVQAVVIEDGLEHSLLGMSFLNRLDGWDVTSAAIILRQ